MANLKDSQRQERNLAKEVGGSVNPGSGNQWLRKGDVRSPIELWECKITSAKSYSLRYADLNKLNNQALLDGRIPIFLVEFLEYGGEYVVMSKDDYMEMRETAYGDAPENGGSPVV